MLNVNWKKTWDDATLEEKIAVVRMYNTYYNNTDEPLTLSKAYANWSGRRWLTIYYTFGVKPAMEI